MDIVNIGPGECRKRLVMGTVILALGMGLGIAFIFLGADRSWRLLLFVPFWMGALGIIQARGKT